MHDDLACGASTERPWPRRLSHASAPSSSVIALRVVSWSARPDELGAEEALDVLAADDPALAQHLGERRRLRRPLLRGPSDRAEALVDLDPLVGRRRDALARGRAPASTGWSSDAICSKWRSAAARNRSSRSSKCT